MATPPASSLRFASTLRTLFSQQARELYAYVTSGFILAGRKVDLSHWLQQVIPVLRPFLIKEWQQGMREAIQNYQRQNRQVMIDYRKLKQVMFSEIDAAIAMFVRTANEALTDKINDKIMELKAQMESGALNRMEAKRQFNSFLQQTMTTPERCFRLAWTESHRARQAGRFALAGMSGKVVKGKRWRAMKGACDFCQSLDGKEVGLDEPFFVRPEGGPYAVIDYPPAHPHCYCVAEEVFVEPKKRRR